MVETYITEQQLERRLRFDYGRLDLNQSEWSSVIGEVIEEATSDVRSMTEPPFDESAYASPDELHTDWPELRSATIRMARSHLFEIIGDGLDQESLGSGASGSGGTYEYRSPKTVRDEVRSELGRVDWSRDYTPPEGEEPTNDVARII